MMKLFFNNRFILSLILLNSLVIFIGGFNIYPLFVNVIDNVITTLFITELVVKLKKYGKNYFKQGWNVFDFILIILSLPTFISYVFGFEVHDLSFLLAFRVMRIFKSFRFLKFIPNIDTLILGIVRALKSSLVVLFGFIVYIFIVGVLSFYLFGTTSPEYFGNPLISLYSTFKIFTIEGWMDIPETLTSNYGEIKSFFTYVYFIFIVLSGGILGVSLVNSIFVDAMLSDNNDELIDKVNNLEKKIDILINQKN